MAFEPPVTGSVAFTEDSSLSSYLEILVLVSPIERQLITLAIAMAANLTACVLIRQDYIVNFIYMIACCIPKSAPHWLWRCCAQVYHVGYLHSGCRGFGFLAPSLRLTRHNRESLTRHLSYHLLHRRLPDRDPRSRISNFPRPFPRPL
jgi:hypothetical protein